MEKDISFDNVVEIIGNLKLKSQKGLLTKKHYQDLSDKYGKDAINNAVSLYITSLSQKQLEKEHKWKQVISLLKNNWCQDKNNIDIMLRLAMECWYILSNWDILDLESSYLEFDSIQSILIETYHYFLNTHSKDDKCLSIFGYMMSLFPNYFYDGHDKTGKMFF